MSTSKSMDYNSTKKVKNMKNKNNFKSVFILLIIILITILLAKHKNIDYLLNTKIYFKSITPDRVLELLNEDNNSKDFILIGRKTCPACIELFPIIKKHIKEDLDINNIYYYDTDKHRDNPLFQELGNKLELSSIPAVVIIKNGKVVLKLNTQGILALQG